ncbi:Zinc finger, C4 type [Aphelenchoides fujianensis]|nr:Zinc finger, C4 type [Aphelenchoides fujianensis]
MSNRRPPPSAMDIGGSLEVALPRPSALPRPPNIRMKLETSPAALAVVSPDPEGETTAGGTAGSNSPSCSTPSSANSSVGTAPAVHKSRHHATTHPLPAHSVQSAGVPFSALDQEHCPICGAPVGATRPPPACSGHRLGFFKRTVQNKKQYQCSAEGKCVVDKTCRKRCPHCRFAKAMACGMRTEVR